MSGHTPGPWIWADYFNGLYSESGECILDYAQYEGMWVPSYENSGVANARLIAAAPELLEALILMRDNPSDNNLNYPEVCAAILKATGGAE